MFPLYVPIDVELGRSTENFRAFHRNRRAGRAPTATALVSTLNTRATDVPSSVSSQSFHPTLPYQNTDNSARGVTWDGEQPPQS
jgi:hypothetical protein